MSEFKQRSFAQRVGTAGENQFRLMAGRQHLTVAIKVEEDFGVDFICQAEQTSGSKSANPMIPAHFGVCVRATNAATGRVKLNRADAANMLRYRQPLVFVLVYLIEPLAPCYYRILDPDFGLMLSQFLNSSNESMTVTPTDCRPEASFRSDLIPALGPSATRRAQLALAELRLKTLVPGATVDLHLDKHGETAIIVADDYFDFFEQLPEDQRDSVYRTAFGRPDLFKRRVTDLPFKSAIPEALIDAPDQLVIAGRILNNDTALEVSGPGGTASAAFVYTRIGTHYGWVHRDGLALTVSSAPKPLHDGTFVHETRVLIDHDADRRLDDMSPDLCKLLTVAVPGALVRDTDSSFVTDVEYFQLPRLCGIVRAYADARKLPGWDPDAVQLRDVTDPACYHTIMTLGTWSARPTWFPNLGLYFDSKQNPIDLQTANRVQKLARVKVVMNTARATIIATVSGTATELWVDDHMIGLGGFTAQNFELDTRALIARDEFYPEIVLSRDVSIVLDPSGARTSDTPSWIDGLGYSPLDEAASK